MKKHKQISFLLNDEQINLSDIAPDFTLLDFLRLKKGLTGTKEGCNEGDCGACTILIGRLVEGRLIYESINACIRFVTSLNACHIVTIEHLKNADGALHPIQEAMIKYHASQCGFCTPGIIMSLYGLWMQNPYPKKAEIELALQGNLCRCTGYAPIIKAAMNISKKGRLAKDILIKQRNEITTKLKKMNGAKRIEIDSKNGKTYIPASISDLAKILQDNPKATIIAGSSDVGLWVNVNFNNISPMVYIGNLIALKKTKISKTGLSIGAAVSYSQAQQTIAKHFPALAGFWEKIGGAQIRNMGTIGGNIANGSPIADMAPPLIALGAKLVLIKGKKQRKISIEDYYISYGKKDLQQGEFIKEIFIPFIKQDEIVAFYKVSKRQYEDISTVSASFNITVKKQKITKAKLAYGGMAAIPSRAKSVEKELLNKDFKKDIFEKAALKMSEDFSPINDVRATAEYRILLAQNLLKRFYLEQGEAK